MAFRVYLDDQGRWTWRLFDRLGRCIAAAPGSFDSKADCLVAIAGVKAAVGAPVTSLD